MPRGQFVYVYRGEWEGERAIVIVKSNALSALAFSGAQLPIRAILEGKASIKIVSGTSGLTLYEAGNATFRATVTDVGERSTTDDDFSVMVWNRGGALFHDVPTTPLLGGNVIVHAPTRGLKPQ